MAHPHLPVDVATFRDAARRRNRGRRAGREAARRVKPRPVAEAGLRRCEPLGACCASLARGAPLPSRRPREKRSPVLRCPALLPCDGRGRSSPAERGVYKQPSVKVPFLTGCLRVVVYKWLTEVVSPPLTRQGAPGLLQAREVLLLVSAPQAGMSEHPTGMLEKKHLDALMLPINNRNFDQNKVHGAFMFCSR